MDAVRTSDGRVVVLKPVKKRDHPFEQEISRLFATPTASSSNAHNHIAPVYEFLQSPFDEDTIFLVMPYLIRVNEVPWATVGEVVECFRQLFEVRAMDLCWIRFR